MWWDYGSYSQYDIGTALIVACHHGYRIGARKALVTSTHPSDMVLLTQKRWKTSSIFLPKTFRMDTFMSQDCSTLILRCWEAPPISIRGARRNCATTYSLKLQLADLHTLNDPRIPLDAAGRLRASDIATCILEHTRIVAVPFYNFSPHP